MLELIVAVFLLSVLVLVHELGHFLAAKQSGVLVEEFGIGMPPRLWGRKVGETLYSINALPLGGFVRLHGETDREESNQPQRGLYAQRPWRRILILAAGIVLNFALGFFIIWGLFAFGHDTLVSPESPEAAQSSIVILSVSENSPAQASGLEPYDRIVAMCDASGCTHDPASDAFTDYMKAHANTEVRLIVDRNGNQETIAAVPREYPPQGEGPLGVSLGLIARVRYGFLQAGWEALKTSCANSVYLLRAIGGMFGRLFTSGDLNGFSGPIGIVRFTSLALNTGASATLNLMAMISLNLAVFNLFPLPALDGGRIAFALWEMVTKKPVSQKIEGLIHTIGFGLFIALLVVVTILDIQRIV